LVPVAGTVRSSTISSGPFGSVISTELLTVTSVPPGFGDSLYTTVQCRMLPGATAAPAVTVSV
jgi:hypothetical protein